MNGRMAIIEELLCLLQMCVVMVIALVICLVAAVHEGSCVDGIFAAPPSNYQDSKRNGE